MSEIKKTELTPEQKQAIIEYNEKREKFIDEQLPYLRKQVEYEKALFDIENYNYNREIVKIRLAELNAPGEPEKDKNKK